MVKLGSAVITREDEHGLALGRLASIVEQVAEYHVEGRECIMVTSGAVAFGKQRLTQELIMSLSMRETLSPTDHTRQDAGTLVEPRAAAAVGQSGLMSLYDAMFAQYGIKIAQVLVTEPDFYNEETRKNLFSTLSELIHLNIVPIINTNDAVVPPMFIVDQEVSATGKKRGIRIKDNDSLAALLAAEIHADLLILMSDVDGIYNKPPWEDGARLMHTYTAGDKNLIKFGEKSKVGTGGMNSKVMAATWALDRGVSVVICNGMQDKAIKSILTGRKVGTFFTESTAEKATPVEQIAENGKPQPSWKEIWVNLTISHSFLSLSQHVMAVECCRILPPPSGHRQSTHWPTCSFRDSRKFSKRTRKIWTRRRSRDWPNRCFPDCP